MKKYIYSLILITVFMLSGCSKKDQMTSFIPTPVPEVAISKAVTPTDTPKAADNAENPEATKAPITEYDGPTTPKYVKLDEYNDTLNVRPTPSTDSAPVGFLVHTEKIDVIEIKDGWASFVYKGAICYVNADFLVDEKPAYLDPPTPTVVPKSNNTTDAGTDGPQI